MGREILLILAVLMILMLIFSQGKISNFTFNQTINQEISCQDFNDCITKLRDMGYSDDEIMQFKIICGDEGCVVYT